MPRTGAVRLALEGLTAEQLKNGEGIKVLNGKYGEFAGTLKDSTDISIKNFENAWSDLMSAMGKSIAETIAPVRDALTSTFKWIIDNKAAVTTALNAVELGFAAIVTVINPIVGGISLAMVGALKLVELFRISTVEMENKVKDLLVLYAGLEDPIQKKARLERELAERTRQEAEKTAREAQERQDKITKEREAATKTYAAELERIDRQEKLGILTKEAASEQRKSALAAEVEALNDIILKYSLTTGETIRLRNEAEKLYAEIIKIESNIGKTVNPYIYQLELTKIAWAQSLIDYQQYLDDMTARATYQATLEEVAYDQRTVEYGAYLSDMADRARYQAAIEAVINEQKLINYIAYLDDMETAAKFSEEKERIAQLQKLEDYQAYLDAMADKEVYTGEVEKIAQEQKLVDYIAYLDERTDQAKLEKEKARIADEQKLIEYQEYLDTMADADKYQTEKAKAEYDQRTVEYDQYLSEMADKAKLEEEKERIAEVQRGIDIAASYEEYIAAMKDKEIAANIATAEYARAVEARDLESKKTVLQKKKEAIQAQLEKELQLVGDNENAKKILTDAANKEILKSQAETFTQYASMALGAISQMFSGIGSLISAQANSAIDAVEDRLESLKKSYGSTASELQTMYDTLEKMGATEKAATIKAQLDKEKAIEDYTSLTMDQLASLYATAIELGDTQTAAEVTAAMARVKAEKDAADQIKQIKYDAAVAEWNIRLMATTASAAQAVMDAYAALAPIDPLVLAPIAAGVAAGVGIVQIAAVAEAKPKLDTGGVVRARDDTSVTVGRGTGEVLLGTSALGDPLVNGIADKIAARIGGQPIVVRLVCDGKTLAEVTAERFNNGQVRLKR